MSCGTSCSAFPAPRLLGRAFWLAAVVACSAAAAAGVAAEESAPASRVALAIEASAPRPYVGQFVDVRLVLSWDRAFFARRGASLFRRNLDVPVQVVVPWWDGAPGWNRVPIAVADVSSDDAPSERLLSLALGAKALEGEPLADEVRDGRTFARVSVLARFRAEAPGKVDLATCTLRYAYADERVEHLLHDAASIDPTRVEVEVPPPTWEVLSLPTTGQPPSFGGAVGEFSWTSEVQTLDEPPGGLRLVLAVSGTGDLGVWSPPRPDAFPGWHGLGVREVNAAHERRFLVDLLPVDARAAALSPWMVSWFDPGPPARYVERQVAFDLDGVAARSAPLPSANGAIAGRSSSTSPWFVGAVALLLALGAIALVAVVVRRRRRARAPAEAAAAALERALARLGACAGATNEEATDALAEVLALATGTPAAGVVGPALAGRLAAVGWPATLAARAAEALEERIALRYGPAAERVVLPLDPHLVADIQAHARGVL